MQLSVASGGSSGLDIQTELVAASTGKITVAPGVAGQVGEYPVTLQACLPDTGFCAEGTESTITVKFPCASIMDLTIGAPLMTVDVGSPVSEVLNDLITPSTWPPLVNSLNNFDGVIGTPAKDIRLADCGEGAAPWSWTFLDATGTTAVDPGLISLSSAYDSTQTINYTPALGQAAGDYTYQLRLETTSGPSVVDSLTKTYEITVRVGCVGVAVLAAGSPTPSPVSVNWGSSTAIPDPGVTFEASPNCAGQLVKTELRIRGHPG
jgi:hypothetical protein